MIPGEHPCPLCSAPLYRKLGTGTGRTQIDCFNPPCLATATARDIEGAVNVLEGVRDEIAFERSRDHDAEREDYRRAIAVGK